MRVVGIALVFLSAVFFSRSLLAVEIKGAENPENLHVRFSSFLAPGLNSKGQRINFPMTLVFEVSKETDIKRFCVMAPRIQDAVTLEVFKRPLRVGKNRKIDSTDFAMRLTSVANSALGKASVVRTHVFNKTLRKGPGSENMADWEVCKNSR